MPFDVTEFMGGSLTHEDLPAPQQTWTVGSVGKRTYDEGTPKAQAKVIVKFAEHSKPLGLNVTNTTRIAVLLGTDADGWIGKQLQVYRTCCDFRGKATLCIRVAGPAEPLAEPLYQVNGAVVSAPAPPQQQQPAVPQQQQQQQQPAVPQQQPAVPQQPGPVEPEAWTED